MRCKTCDYSLWNITARKCPECGTDFQPSDFQFVPNSVRFLCPHCEQDYYGTTEHGHLIPRTFHCVRCSQRIDMDEMLLLPAAGVDESRTAADVMPWLARRKIGWFRGWIRTIGQSMVAPHRLAKSIPRDAHGGVGEAAMFCLITSALVMGAGMGLFLAIMGVIAAASGDRDAPEMLLAALLTTVLGGIAILVLATVWGLIAHVLLKTSGKTARGVGGTLKAMYYSSGANILSGVPCLGFYFSGVIWIWWLVSAILMIMSIQSVRGLRATLCVSVGPLLGVIATTAYVFWIIAAIGRTLPGGAAMPGGFGSAGPAMSEAIIMRDALLAYSAANNGAMPGHMVEFVAAGRLAPADFVLLQLGHDEARIVLPAGGMTLDQILYLPTNRRAMAAAAETAALPQDVVAHRVGDFVFTYHGLPAASADSGSLWMAILWPDPDQAGGGVAQSMNAIAIAQDGSLIPIVPNMMPTMLQVQNGARAEHKLPPLPDPATVRNTVPAAVP